MELRPRWQLLPVRAGSIRTARLLTIGLFAVVVALAAGCGSGSEGGKLNGMTRNPPSQVGSSSLPQGNPESEIPKGTLAGPEDGLTLVYFGFTYCPDVCPTTLADLRLALEDLDEEERARTHVAMVTVDPERETFGVLNGYLAHFFPESDFSTLRTTDRTRLARVERLFGASHRLGKPDREGNYDVSHTAQLYAVDQRGTVAVEWPFGTEAGAIASDLELLLERADDRPGA